MERTGQRNTEISLDRKLTVSPVSFAKLTAQGALALLAVSFQFVWTATLPSRMMDEDRFNYSRWTTPYQGGDSATHGPGLITVPHMGRPHHSAPHRPGLITVLHIGNRATGEETLVLTLHYLHYSLL